MLAIVPVRGRKQKGFARYNKAMDYINCIVMEESRAHILLLIKQKGPAFLLGKDNFSG